MRKLTVMCAVTFAAVALLTTNALAATSIVGAPAASLDGPGGACSPCVALQVTNHPSDESYAVASDGVITRYVFWAGSSVNPGATARLQVYRENGPGSWLLAGQSEDLPYSAGDHTLGRAHVKVRAGDVLALRLSHTGANTPLTHAGSHSLSVIGSHTLDPAIGDAVAVTETATSKVNVAAWVEPDADGDGYGDDSQDLCPSDPAEQTDACSGTLLGDDLQAISYAGSPCPTGPLCSVVQTSGEFNWSVPFDGVVLRWRYKEGTSGKDYRLRVLRPTGSPGEFSSIAESDPLGYPGNGSIARAATRLPVRNGDQLGLSGQGPFWHHYTAGGTSRLLDPDPAVGVTSGSTDLVSGVSYLYNADIEPDADHDLWGDLTEDVCPTDASRRDDCNAPSITGFKLSKTRFVVDNKGAVVSRRLTKGTVFSLNVSEAGRLKFNIERATKGMIKSNKCRKVKSARGRSPKMCNVWSKVHDFSVDSTSGAMSMPYSGRYKSGKKTKRLSAGRYRVTAYASDASGNSTATAPIEFNVAASPKSRSSK